MCQNRPMLPPSSWVLTEAYAGLQAQARGLAEAAGLAPELRVFQPHGLWRRIPARWWPKPLRAVRPADVAPPIPELVIGCGGKSAAVLTALGRRTRTVIVQHPRIDIRRFDLVVAARHDELSGPNVLVTRTAMHRVTPARLAEAAALWAPRLAHLPRPLVAVLVGGTNGRFRLDAATGQRLAGELALMMRRDRVGVAVTPSRRTDQRVTNILVDRLPERDSYVWDLSGENPYFGLLGLADAIIVTNDSVSMLSEAVATSAPVLVFTLPGRSRRISLFTQALIDDGRVRPYQGRLATWAAEPVDDTAAAAAEMRQCFGY